jgi:hypothetical protein
MRVSVTRSRTLRSVVVALASGVVACGSGSASSGGGTSPGSSGAGTSGAAGTCSANIPDGGACNTIANVGPTVTRTCATGTIPTGTGGTIANGTYVLTAETYYAGGSCPEPSLSVTLVADGDCWQEVAASGAANNSTSFDAAFAVAVQGNQVTTTPTCVDGPASREAASATFTASGGTLTVFSVHSAAEHTTADVADVFTRQ